MNQGFSKPLTWILLASAIVLCGCREESESPIGKSYHYNNKIYYFYTVNSATTDAGVAEYDENGKPTGRPVEPWEIGRIQEHGSVIRDPIPVTTSGADSSARAAAAAYAPRLFVLDTFGNDVGVAQVRVFDPDTFQQLQMISVDGATSMASAPGSSHLYVAQKATDGVPARVSVIDMDQMAAVDSISLDLGIYPDLGEKAIAISPDERYLYITGRHFDQSALIDVVDLEQRKIVKTLQPFSDAFSTMIELSPDGQQLLAATGTSDLVLYDTLTLTNTVRKQFYGGNFLRFHPDGSRFYTLLGFTLQAWDSATLTPVDAESFPLSDSLQQFDDITIDADGYFAYVNIQQTGQIYVVDLLGKTVTDIVETGGVGLTRVLVTH